MAAYQRNSGATLLAAAPDCAASRVMLEALEAGTDGVLLRTDSPAEVRGLPGRAAAAARFLRQRRSPWPHREASCCRLCLMLAVRAPAVQVRALARYLQERRQQGAQRLRYEAATVTAVRPVGMGDRACVDLCW